MDFECQVDMASGDGADGETLDPRIKMELEYLNNSSIEINTLELLLDDANSTFRQTLNEYSQKLKSMKNKIGKSISVARPYFEVEEAAHEAKLECEKAAVRYHRACSAHKEAREAIAVAEKKFNSCKDECQFDAAWQEMLNRETEKLMKAEKLKKDMEDEHRGKTEHYSQLVSRSKYYEQHFKGAINKSKGYFEQKKLFMRVLDDLKKRVESLQKAVQDAKGSYANCLRNLEMISKEIHDRRKVNLPPREPGVGAEYDSPPPENAEMESELSELSIYPKYGASETDPWDAETERMKLDKLCENLSLTDLDESPSPSSILATSPPDLNAVVSACHFPSFNPSAGLKMPRPEACGRSRFGTLVENDVDVKSSAPREPAKDLQCASGEFHDVDLSS